MRRFFVPALAVAAALCVTALPSFAQSEPSPSTNTPIEESAEQQYRDAVALLRNGRKFEAAIAKLQNAVQQNPNNASYHSALGCALTSRAVAIADAARQAAEYPNLLSNYDDAVVLWKAAQKQPGAILYGQPRPLPPFLPATKDDGKAFKISKEQAEQAYDALGKEAIAEWEAGFKVARTDDEKAQAYFLTGWGKSVLRVGNSDVKLSTELQREITPKKCVEAVQAAAAVSPNNPAIWRGVGDVCLMDSFTGKGSSSFKYNKEAAQAYERCLAHNRKALDLWYVLFLMESRHDIAGAETALNQALRLDKANAFLWYEKAYLLPDCFTGSIRKYADLPDSDAAKINAAQWTQILSTIETGNSLGRYQLVEIHPQPPLLLTSAWRICIKQDPPLASHFGMTSFYFYNLYFDKIASAKTPYDENGGQRWSKAAIGMGRTFGREILEGKLSPISQPKLSAAGARGYEARDFLRQGYNGLIAFQKSVGYVGISELQDEEERACDKIDAWAKAFFDSHKSQHNRASAEE